jgi:hypothetical protein
MQKEGEFVARRTTECLASWVTWFWKSVSTDGSETEQAGGWPEKFLARTVILSGCGLKNKFGTGGRNGILDLPHPWRADGFFCRNLRKARLCRLQRSKRLCRDFRQFIPFTAPAANDGSVIIALSTGTHY